ncbi:fungal-specific transcription factor domain-containing protein [Dactylonectria macrodidyma]|uniref:Fungal-specific transcription factor domain-containing protein n=1 Tax=Dactylonectria macrodidyma TaxID=307937 RepID=A0A9P9F5R5_9HYPO|nr:fungal-specific transcription factor domain-containing protein [Dactylonectria macrodidyma]
MNSSPLSSRLASQEGNDKPSALACIQCRRKHVKCDAGVPECQQCRSTATQCHYQPSRRGLKRRNIYLKQTVRSSDDLAPIREKQKIQPGDDLTSVSLEEEMVEDDELLINLFYANFHFAHPFLVPRGLYFSQNYPPFLRVVVHLIGCHFSGTACSETLEGISSRAVERARINGNHDFVLVQAMLLLSIALHARNDSDKSVSMLSKAVSLAIQIGLHRKDYALIHGKGSPVLEESLRRTWWELYVTDGFMAALQQRTSFRCYAIETDVPLPCDESMYVEGGFMTEPATLSQFDARIYSEEESRFSSFAYRIEAVRILARALAIARIHDIHRDQIQAIDNALAAWPHYLDLGKAEPTDVSGEVDDMLLQAHMFIQYTTMILHFPRSDLIDAIPTIASKMPTSSLLPVYSRPMHGVKAVEAAKRLGNLAALQDSAQKHSPFFLNGLLLSSVVQLSACSLRPSGFQQHYRDRLSLSTGVLKTLSPVWALARSTWGTINTMTLEALSKNNQLISGQAKSLGDSAIEVGTSAAEFSITDLSWMEIPTWATG